jgi:hypothetical protein
LKLTITSAWSIIFCVTFACRSSATAIGASGSAARTRASRSPSPSADCSATIAPCRSSITASQPGVAATIASQIAAYASAATGPLGFAAADTGVTISAPSRTAASMNAAIAVRIPWFARYASSPQSGPLRPNAVSGVGTGENVFVS